MTSRFLAIGLLATLGTGLTAKVAPGHGRGPDVPLDPASRSELNREIERRLDLAVNGRPAGCSEIREPSGPFHPPRATRFVAQAPPCSSPEPWRTQP